MKIVNIKRLAMATAMLLAVNMNANAQDELKNTVQQQAANVQVDMARQQDVEKKLAKLQRERAANEKTAQDQAGQTGNLPLADVKNGDVEFFYFDGRRMGIYHTKTKAFDLFKRDASSNKWLIYTFDINNSGVVSYKGNEVGIINSDGSMKSGQTKGIFLDGQNFVYWNGKRVGSVSATCEIYLFSNIMAYYYSPIDPKIAAFFVFCETFTDTSIKEHIANNTAAKIKPGSLNAQYHSAALASIQKRIQGVQDVVITSNEWRIIRDDLGNIISRACDGWYFIKNGTGRRAISYCWKQSYLGGGNYDSLEASAANGFDPIDLE
jgi:hypothetical protein